MMEFLRAGAVMATLAVPGGTVQVPEPVAVVVPVVAERRTDSPAPAWTGAGLDRSATQAPDPWLGEDKFQHFWMSYAVTAFVFAGTRMAGAETDAALHVAVPVAALAGVGKEVHDVRSGGPFSLRDLVADGLGVAAAFFLLREVR